MYLEDKNSVKGRWNVTVETQSIMAERVMASGEEHRIQSLVFDQ